MTNECGWGVGWGEGVSGRTRVRLCGNIGMGAGLIYLVLPPHGLVQERFAYFGPQWWLMVLIIQDNLFKSFKIKVSKGTHITHAACSNNVLDLSQNIIYIVMTTVARCSQMYEWSRWVEITCTNLEVELHVYTLFIDKFTLRNVFSLTSFSISSIIKLYLCISKLILTVIQILYYYDK